MIIKQTRLKNTTASTVKNLGQYILHGRDNSKVQHRVLHQFVGNVLAEEINEELYRQINATMKANTRAKGSKIEHIIISLKPNEHLEANQWEEVAHSILNELNMEDHQYFATVHKDTDSEHLHLAINKINPTTLKINTLSNSKRKLSALAANLEQKYNLEQIDHKAQKNQTQREAQDLEHLTGQMSFYTYLNTFKHDLLQAHSWQQFHEILESHGVRAVKKKRGLNFCCNYEGRELYLKASGVDRKLSINQLEKNLGTFIDYDYSHIDDAQFNYEPKPATFNDQELENKLYLEYKAFLQKNRDSKRFLISKLNKSFNAQISRIKNAHYALDSTIRKIYKDKAIQKHEILYYTQITQKKIKEIEALRKLEIERIENNYKDLSFMEYLKQSDTDISRQLLFSREGAFLQSGDIAYNETIISEQMHLNLFVFIKRTNKGANIFTSTINSDMIKEDGCKLIISKNASLLTLKEALHIASHKFKSPIKINGSVDYQTKVSLLAARLGINIECNNQIIQNNYLKEKAKYDRFRQSRTTASIAGGKGQFRQRANRPITATEFFRETLDRSDRITSTFSLFANRNSVTYSFKSDREELHQDTNKLHMPKMSKRIMDGENRRGAVLLHDPKTDLLGSQQQQNISQTVRWIIPDTEQSGIEKYIVERNNKFNQGFKDVLEHRLWIKEYGTFQYIGQRNIESKIYGLFKKDNTIFVKELNNYAARRLKQGGKNTQVQIDQNGNVSVLRRRLKK